MTNTLPEVVPCPNRYRAEALSLVLCDVAPSQRQDVGATLLQSSPDPVELAGGGLFVALRGEKLCGAAWGQRQPGNTAVFWPPQLVSGETDQTAYQLAIRVAAELDRARIGMSQVFLPGGEVEHVEVITAAGFHLLAELLYLSWEAGQRAAQTPIEIQLDFAAYDASQSGRLTALVERTYEGSLDCPALNGTRPIDDVIAGYRATGAYCEENWLIAQRGGRDVGVLILADHPSARHWELVYMGLIPEARGCGLGRQIAQHAQRLATCAKAERVVLAVDATNEPALRMYHAAGFQSWDRRAVYVRFLR
jgi:ribosomal protein S18 acetylase RimI-like enzyme